MTRTPLNVLLLSLTLAACSGNESASAGLESSTVAADTDPVAHLREFVAEFVAQPEHTDERVRVQHVLIAFEGSGTNKPITRSQEEAETLAGEILIRIQNGESFDRMVKEFTDDAYPGIYTMVIEPRPNETTRVFERNRMVPAFGNVGWRLQMDEIGVAAYDTTASPYGWHIVKRVK